MDRREFLKMAVVGTGALALPGVALADGLGKKAVNHVIGVDRALGPDTGVYTIYRAVGIVSGWTKPFTDGRRDHYDPEAVHKIFKLAEAKLEAGRVPLLDCYDTSKPPVGVVTQLQIHESRDIQRIRKVHTAHDEYELVPGTPTAYITVEFASLRDDLEGKFVGPGILCGDHLPMTGETPAEMILDVDSWSIHDNTVFQAPDMNMAVQKGGIFMLQEAHFVGKLPPRVDLPVRG